MNKLTLTHSPTCETAVVAPLYIMLLLLLTSLPVPFRSADCFVFLVCLDCRVLTSCSMLFLTNVDNHALQCSEALSYGTVMSTTRIENS